MGMWPVRASSTWAGVRITRRGQTDLIPWSEALSQMFRRPGGTTVNLNFASQRDSILAAAHRRRAVRTAIRTGTPIRWANAASDSWLPEFAFPSLLTLTLSGMILGFLWQRRGVFIREDALPLAAHLATMLVFGVLLLASTLGTAMLLRFFWTAARTETLAAEISRDKLAITTRTSTRTIASADIASVHRSLATTITLRSGERISLRSLPRAIVDTWLIKVRPRDLAQIHRADHAAYRRIAIGAPLIGLAIGLLGAWLESPRFATTADAALFVAEITFFMTLVGTLPWLLTRRLKRAPALA